MEECKFKNTVGAEAVGFSHGDFGLVVQAFHNTAGNQLLSPEVVEGQLPVLTERPRGSIPERMVWRHDSSRNLPAQAVSCNPRVVERLP
jgi:hypothetical protein